MIWQITSIRLRHTEVVSKATSHLWVWIHNLKAFLDSPENEACQIFSLDPLLFAASCAERSQSSRSSAIQANPCFLISWVSLEAGAREAAADAFGSAPVLDTVVLGSRFEAVLVLRPDVGNSLDSACEPPWIRAIFNSSVGTRRNLSHSTDQQ